MDSDASASEVESEIIEEEVEQYVDEVFDEVGENVQSVAKQDATAKATVVAIGIQSLQGQSRGSKPNDRFRSMKNADEEDNDDGDNYSVDFEEEEQEPAAQVKPTKSKTVRPPAITTMMSPTPTNGSEYEYDMTSFEEESRSRSPTHSNSPRHLVDLSVPIRADSIRIDNHATSSPSNSISRSPSKIIGSLAMPFPSSTSPSAIKAIDYKVLSKPHSTADLLQDKHQNEGDKGLSLLLRKIESKFHDEIEELREKNAVLTWKERELKSQLRRVREDAKIRKSHMDRKRRRALERRLDHDKMVENLRQSVDEFQLKESAMQQALQEEQARTQQLLRRLDDADQDKKQLELRNGTLTDRVQSVLDDFHALNLKFQQAVEDKLQAEKRLEQQLLCHQVELQAVEAKCQLQVQAANERLTKEVEARALERVELPEAHRVLVEAHKERFERLEALLMEEKRALESQAAKERVAMEQQVQRCAQQVQAAEDKAAKRVQEELEGINRERQAVDEQRRELLLMVARTTARFDEERARMESQRAQLDAKQRELTQQQVEVETKTTIWQERREQLLAEDEKLRLLQQQVKAMGQETYEKSRLVANEMNACTGLKDELSKLRATQNELLAKNQQSEHARQALQNEKLELEKINYELQRERLLVAKQRMESRQLLDGAKKLESLLRQQSAFGPSSSRAAAG